MFGYCTFLTFFITIFISASTYSAEAEIFVNGIRVEKLDYVIVGEKIKIVVNSSKGDRVSASFGKNKISGKKTTPLELELEVKKSDLKVGYVIAKVFYLNSEGSTKNSFVTLDSFVKVIQVKSKEQVDKMLLETEEEKLKRVLQELGVDKVKEYCPDNLK